MTATARFSEGFGAPVLARMWWAVLLRGAAILIFGLLAFFWAKDSLPTLVTLFAAYAVADGILSIVGAIRGGGLVERGGLALAGAVSIAAGVIASLWPGMTTPVLMLIVGAWAVGRGGLEFVSALRLRQVMERDWSLAAIGGLSVVFGVMLILYPRFDTWTFVRVLSAYVLIVSSLMFLLSYRFAKGLRP